MRHFVTLSSMCEDVALKLGMFKRDINEMFHHCMCTYIHTYGTADSVQCTVKCLPHNVILQQAECTTSLSLSFQWQTFPVYRSAPWGRSSGD